MKGNDMDSKLWALIENCQFWSMNWLHAHVILNFIPFKYNSFDASVVLKNISQQTESESEKS